MKHSTDILLVNPWIHDFAAYDYWAKPLGLLSIASLLQRQGVQVHLIDCLNSVHPDLVHESHASMPKRTLWGSGNYRKEEIEKPEILRHVARKYSRYGISPSIFERELRAVPRPDAVFVTSMMTYWYPGVCETIDHIRRVFTGMPIVLGGNYATLCYEHATVHSGADIVFAGEAECRLSDLLHEILGQRFDGGSDIEQAESFPYPAYDLLSSPEQVAIMTSRGCPFNCNYCASSYLNPTFCERDPIAVVDEIEYWRRTYGIRNFSFYDDALLVNPEKRIIPILEDILRRELDCKFHCPNGLHIREIKEDIAFLMCRTGFQTVRFGFETSDRARQVRSGGKISNEETKQAIGHLKKAGYAASDIGMYILCGLPGQEACEVEESIRFIQSCGARPIIAEYSPIPHTDLWGDAIESSPYDIENEPLFHNNTLLPCGGKTMCYHEYQRLKNMARGGAILP